MVFLMRVVEKPIRGRRVFRFTNNNKSYKNKAILALFLVLLVGFTINASLTTFSYADTFGGTGGEDTANRPTGCQNPPCSGSNDGSHIRWVYFKIKDGADAYIANNYASGTNPWVIENLDVSACARTEGLYFSFYANNSSTSLKKHQSTLPYNGYTCNYEQNKCNMGCCAIMWMYYTNHDGTALPVDTSIYDSNIFEPEYIFKAPSGGTLHSPAVTDLNGNGEVEGRFIWYDKPNDVQLYIANEWENNIKNKKFPGNDYYWVSAEDHGSKCYDWRGNVSENACRIVPYDWPSGYTYYDNTHLSYTGGGNNGWKRDGSYAQGSTNVNVSWFCSGEERIKTYNGSFTGSISMGAPGSTTSLGGTSYLGSYGTSSYSATATGSITRNDSETNISSLTAKGHFQTCTSTTESTCTDIADTSFSQGLAINGTKTSTNTASTGDIAVGGSATVCRRLVYLGSASVTNGVQTDGSNVGTSVSCYTVYRPARATFSGSVATPSSNSDSNIKNSNGANLLGDGSTTSYKIKTTYTITRTNDNPTNATSKYTTSSSSQPSAAGTLSSSLQNTGTYNPTSNTTKTVTQNVGTASDHCFYMTYENRIDYYGGTNRLDSINGIDKVSGCTKLYNPRYASITSSMDVSVTGMTGSASTGFRGNGYTTKYYPVVHYMLKRASNAANATPTNASSRFAVNTAASTSLDNTKYPSSVPGSGTGKGGTATGLYKDKSPAYDYPVSFEIDFTNVSQGSTVTKCSYMKYDSTVGYIGDSILSTPFDTRSQSQNSLCVNFFNPYKYTATFSGSITSTNGSYVTGTGDTNGTDNTRVGNGLYGQYTITPSYKVTRTNNSPEIGVSSRYGTSDSSQPTSSSAKTKDLKKDENNPIAGSSKTVVVDIGGTAKQCFYISYDNQVGLIGNDSPGSSSADVVIGKPDGTKEDRSFNGKQYVCYTYTNPAQHYTAHYSGSSSGTIDAHTWLERSNDNHTGVLDNAIRISGTNSDTDGSYTDHFPKKNDGTADDKYTVSFTHTINRTDADKSSTQTTIYYVPSTAYNWEIQDCEDTACEAGIYSKYSASTKDTNTSRTISGIKSTLTAGATNTVQTQPRFTFNASNKGKYLYYCQRVAYSTTAYYTSATDTNNRNWHLDSLDGTSITVVSYSTPACVTIKNPAWAEADSTEHTHYIDVSGLPKSVIQANGARALSTNQYETTEINLAFLFDHTVTRYDNTTWRNSNFDETDISATNTQYFTNNANGRAFFQPSIYRNSRYDVTLKMYGSETLPGTRNTVTLVNPLKLQNGSLAEIDGKQISLNATDKDHGDSWTSSANDGRTRISFNGIDRATLNTTIANEKVLSDHSLMAGDTKQFTMSTYNRRAAWTVRYKEIMRQEVYPRSWKSNASGPQRYNRTEKLDTAPVTTTPVNRDSRDTTTPTTYSVFRPYNFIITNITNTNVDSIALAGDRYTVDYTITVNRENGEHNYITDPNHTENSRYVYVIGYTVNTYATPEQLQTLTPTHAPINNTGNVSSDLCSSIRGNSFVASCEVLTEGHPNKLSSKAGQTADPGTSFKHVYNLNNYDLSYSTGTITVPDLAVGQKYCVAIAVRNYSSASSNYFISTSSCRNISKRPTLEVWGGSVLSNGDITTSSSTRNDKVFGSWADYTIVANGTIKGMASGATLINGATVTSSACKTVPNPLTISNAYCNNTTNKYLGRASVDARLDAIGTIKEYLTGNVTLDDIPLICDGGGCSRQAAGNKTYVVRTDGDVIIDKNIYNFYSSSQIIIIGKDIKIDQSVTRIDALLVAAGTDNNGGIVDTCMNYDASELSSTVCTNRLTINGSVMAQKVLFKRTSGGDPVSSIREPAEVINYQPSSFIWGYNRSVNRHNPQTVYLKKLPPRY